MQQINDFLMSIVTVINKYLSNYILIFLLLGCGLIFTIRTKFVQVRFFGDGLKSVFGNIKFRGGKHKGGMSSFQALATAIAAQVGTGNIVGACGAILIGGPGAIFWMWIITFFGMSTIYAEAVLAQKTRVVSEDGSIAGGPVYYIRSVFKKKFGKFLAGFFSIAIIFALGFMGSMVQSNSIAGSCETAFHTPQWLIGIIVCAVAGFIFIGGVNRIASVTEKIVPIMAVLYLVGCLVLIGQRITYIPATFGMIFKYAFQPQSLIGGSIGSAIVVALTQGAKRGLFSNEAGMGSTPHAHALATNTTPHKQGTVAIFGVFVTFVVLTITAIVVISTLYMDNGVLAPLVETGSLDFASAAKALGVTNNNMAQIAFQSLFGKTVGSAFIAICLLFFAFSTIISWNYFGKVNFEYLFGKKYSLIYTIVSLAFIFFGSVLSPELVWELADMFNNLMVIPNVIALVALSGVVSKVAKQATAERKERKMQKQKEKNATASVK